MILHLLETTTLGIFMEITAKDGTVLRVWNGTRDKIVSGNTYYAYPLAPSQLKAAEGLKADNLDVNAVYSGTFTAQTLRAKKWQGARVVYQTLNYKDFTMGYAERRVCYLGKSTIGKRAAQIELNSLSSKLNEPWGLTCTKECDVDAFGDTRCGKSLAGNTVDGFKIVTAAHISAVTNPQQMTIVFDEFFKPSNHAITVAPDGFFDRGKIHFITGPNAGADCQILTNTGNVLTLYLPLPYPEIAADTDDCELTVGCDRKISTCRDKFANVTRFRGLGAYLPGRSKVLKLPA